MSACQSVYYERICELLDGHQGPHQSKTVNDRATSVGWRSWSDSAAELANLESDIAKSMARADAEVDRIDRVIGCSEGVWCAHPNVQDGFDCYEAHIPDSEWCDPCKSRAKEDNA